MLVDRSCRYILDGDREELKGIRSELSALRQLRQPPASIHRPQYDYDRTSEAAQWKNYGIEQSAQVKRNTGDVLHQLLAERKQLLNTGLYDVTDALIVELDQSILKTKARVAEGVDHIRD